MVFTEEIWVRVPATLAKVVAQRLWERAPPNPIPLAVSSRTGREPAVTNPPWLHRWAGGLWASPLR